MQMADEMTAELIRAEKEKNPTLRARDLADRLGVAEAALVAADVGRGAIRIEANPDRLIPAVAGLGEVMALTRNESCVHEKVGHYDNYHPGRHAAMVLTPDIDLRIFPSHWIHAFAVEAEGADGGLRRSVQIFDAAGDAVHKIYVREQSDLSGWTRLRADLTTGDTADTVTLAPRQAPEAPKSAPAKVEILREEWGRMTDTHQFLRLTSKLKMNRLGAYRIVGDGFVRALAPSSVTAALQAVSASGIDVMVFCGNRGCIQIHSGPIATIKPMGPWQNVIDSGFNLHLRLDHVAEVWAVRKPTQRGTAVSLEAFDAKGALILQIFGFGRDGKDDRPAWSEIVDGLESAE